MSRAIVAAMLFAMALPAFAAAPVARVRPDGSVVVSLPIEILQHREVQRKLPSGLTTTFMLIATAGTRRGGARVEIRFEPWDEVYFVTTRTIDHIGQTQRLESLDKLHAWWRAASIPVFPAGSVPPQMQVRVEVLPFSVSEQEETQRWLARSVRAAQEGTGPEDVSGGTSVLDLLISTSIQRRPLVRYSWTVTVPR